MEWNGKGRMNTRKIGKKYEDMAAAYLEQKGYEILHRNYRNSYGEIDLVARRKAQLVFCEVKFRSSNRYGSPFDAVDQRKRHRISRTALYYCITQGYGESVSCRFDVIGVDGNGTLIHMENAFWFG